MADLTSRLILSLIDRVTAPARGVQQALGQMTARIERNNAALASARGDLVGAAATATAFAVALAAPVRAAMRFEEALADVTKVADFSVPGSYEEFTEGLRDLSREVPIAVGGLAEIAAIGAQSGIRTEDLLAFTEAAAKIGVAFDIGAAEAASALTSLQASLGISLDEAILLTDGMNHLSNAQASGADDILDMTLRVGALGKQFGFANAEVAAFGSAMISAGAAPDVAATSFANMGYALTAGTGATKRQREAYAALGMEAEDIARRMQEDATGTTIAVMEAISALPAELQSTVSVDLFGREARAVIPLLTNLDLLRQSLGLVEEEATYAGSAFQEFMNRNRTFAMRLQRFNNVMTDLSIVVGQALIPGLIVMMDHMQPILETMIDWVEVNGDPVATIARVVGSLFALRLGLLALKVIGLTGLGGYLSLLSMGLGSVGRAAAAAGRRAGEIYALQAALAGMSGVRMGKLDAVRAGLRGIAGVTGLSAAASAIGAVAGAVAAISAPVWLTVAALAATVAAIGFVLYRSWDRITAIFEGVGLAIMDQLQPALDWLASFDMPDALVGFFDRFGDAMAQSGREALAIWQAVKDWFGSFSFAQEILPAEEREQIVADARAVANNVIDAFLWLPKKLYQIGADAIANLISGLRSGLDAALEGARSVARAIGNAMEGAYGGGGMAPASEPGVGWDPMGGITQHARGGNMRGGEPAIVGEEGEELIFPSHSGYVVAAQQTRRLLDMARRASVAAPRAMVPRPLSSVSGAAAGGRSSSSTTVHLGGITIHAAPNMDVRELARHVAREIGTTVRVQTGSDYSLAPG